MLKHWDNSVPFWLTVVPYLTAFSPAHPTLEGNWGTGPPTPLRVAVPLPVGCCWLLPNKDPFGQVKNKRATHSFYPNGEKSAAYFIFGELEKCDVSFHFTFQPIFDVVDERPFPSYFGSTELFEQVPAPL